jgi:hypothetical protein
MKQIGRPVQLIMAILPRFDKTKLKCYNCEKIDHYAKDYWNLTIRVEENVNLIVEGEKKATLLLIHNDQMQAKKTCGI